MKTIVKLAGMAALLMPLVAQAQPPGGYKGHGDGPGAMQGHDGKRDGMRGPGGPGGMRGPGGPGSFRRNAKMQIGGLIRGIGVLETQKKTPLSKDQAKKIVATLKVWQKKPKMSEAEAKSVSAKLNSFLTTPQKTALAAMKPPRRGFGGRGPGGPGRDGGPGGMRGPRDHDDKRGPGGPGGMRGPGGQDGMRGPGGFGGMRGPGGPGGGFGGAPPTAQQMQEMRQRMEKMRGFMETFNPLYPVGSYKEVKALPDRMQERLKEHYTAQQAVLTQLARKAK